MALSLLSLAITVQSPLSKATIGKLGFVYFCYDIATRLLLKSEKVKQLCIGKITQEYASYLAKPKEQSKAVVVPAIRFSLYIVQWTTGLPWVGIISQAFTLATQLSETVSQDDFKEACEEEAKNLIVSAITVRAQVHLDQLSTPRGILFGLDFPSIKQIIHDRLQAELAERITKRLNIADRHKDEVGEIVSKIIKDLDDLYQGWEYIGG